MLILGEIIIIMTIIRYNKTRNDNDSGNDNDKNNKIMINAIITMKK